MCIASAWIPTRLRYIDRKKTHRPNPAPARPIFPIYARVPSYTRVDGAMILHMPKFRCWSPETSTLLETCAVQRPNIGNSIAHALDPQLMHVVDLLSSGNLLL